ncbi:MAG: O-antigen ligase family protein [bacterium]|nr:O-antigen ligase family protein [bacterium]
MKLLIEVFILAGLVCALVRPKWLVYFLIFSLLEPSRTFSLGNYTVLGTVNIKFCEITLVFLGLGALLNRCRPVWSCVKLSEIIFAVFAVVSLVRGVVVFDFGEAAFNQFRTFAAMAMTLIIPLLYRTRDEVQPVLRFFGAVVCVMGAIEFLDILHLNPLTDLMNSPYRTMSMMGGTPGGMLAMPFLYIVSTWRFHERGRMTALLVMIWCFVLSVMSASRGVWMGLLGGIAGLLWFLPLRRKIATVLTVLALVLLAVVFSRGYYVERYDVNLLSRIKYMVDPNEGNAQWRLYAWQQMVQDIREHPWVGWPFGSDSSFYVSGDRYQEVAPHNEYLKIARYTGIFGLCAFLAFLTSVFVTGVRFIQRTRGMRECNEMIGLLLCFLFHIITSFVTQEFTTLDISAIVWAIPGIVLVYDLADRERRRAPVSGARAPQPVLA